MAMPRSTACRAPATRAQPGPSRVHDGGSANASASLRARPVRGPSRQIRRLPCDDSRHMSALSRAAGLVQMHSPHSLQRPCASCAHDLSRSTETCQPVPFDRLGSRARPGGPCWQGTHPFRRAHEQAVADLISPTPTLTKSFSRRDTPGAPACWPSAGAKSERRLPTSAF